MPASATPSRVRVTFKVNTNTHNQRVWVWKVPRMDDSTGKTMMNSVLHTAKTKLKLRKKARRVFDAHTGEELLASSIRQHLKQALERGTWELLVSLGEECSIRRVALEEDTTLPESEGRESILVDSCTALLTFWLEQLVGATGRAIVLDSLCRTEPPLLISDVSGPPHGDSSLSNLGVCVCACVCGRLC